MPPKADARIAPSDFVDNSNFQVYRSEIRKTKTVITANLNTLTLEIQKLKKTPAPPFFRKKSHMSTIEHCRAQANNAMSALRDISTSAESTLGDNHITSTIEAAAVTAAIKDLHDGLTEYSNLIDEFDDANAMFIEDIIVEVNSGQTANMPPTPGHPPFKFKSQSIPMQI